MTPKSDNEVTYKGFTIRHVKVQDKSDNYVGEYPDVKTAKQAINAETWNFGDSLADNHEPIQSFAGTADNVRKHSMRFLAEHVPNVSLEHAAYIGHQLELADIWRLDYVQDMLKPNAKAIRWNIL